MISLPSQQRRDWIYGMIFCLLTLVMAALFCWLKFDELAQLDADIHQEQLAVQELKAQQQRYFEDGLGDQLAQYSESIQAIEAVLYARDEVFTGLMSEDRFEPVVLLDLVEFFELLQRLLSHKTLLNSFSLSPTGSVSFLVRTTSYADAAQQMDALRLGLDKGEQQRVLNDGEVELVLPHLFMNVVISNVSRTELSFSDEDLPPLLRGREASYDFVVQMDINPDYFDVLREQEQEPITNS